MVENSSSHIQHGERRSHGHNRTAPNLGRTYIAMHSSALNKFVLELRATGRLGSKIEAEFRTLKKYISITFKTLE